MQFLLLGMVALLLLLLATRAYTMANPQVLARQLRIGAGVVVLAGAGILVVRGMVGYAMSLAALGSWLLWGGGGVRGRARQTPGQTSRVATEHLEVELDHDSGEIRGRVLKGALQGRELEGLSPREIAGLWNACRCGDPQSAQILEAYLDRRYPDWREDVAGAGGEARPTAAMTREEALKVLGLEGGASEAEIRRAHRELMLKVHPDRGGSAFLAVKINEAKDVLLGKG
jgi:DnaJ-domain-containing protein 1